MAAIPKLLKCYDCDQTFTREEVFGAMEDLVPGYCQHRSVASHTGTDIMKFPFCMEIETALGTIQVLRHQRSGWVGSENGNF